MVRRTTHLALVVFAVLVATGPSAVVLADADGATGTDSGVAAVGPLDATDDLPDETTDDDLVDENTTGETTATNSTEESTTDQSLTDENLTEEETVENGTLDDETTDATATETDETTTDETTINATEHATTDPADTVIDPEDRPTDLDADADATTDLEALASDATNESETATNVADGTDTADVPETIDDAASGVPDANLESVSLDAAASPSPRTDAEDAIDAPFEAGDAEIAEHAGEGPDSGVPDDSDPATGQERRTENETTAAVTGGDSGSGSDAATNDEMGGDAGGNDAGGSDAGGGDEGTDDAKSPAGEADSDGSPDRDSPANPPSGTEAVAGAGALAAVAVFPHLADGLTVASDAGALSAASSTATRSHALSSLQAELDKVWRTATAFRYSRYDDSDPLAHETRATLHETVERSPGAYLSQVCERADVAVSTARHHLDVLEDEGLVTTAKVRGKRRYFPGRGDDVELAAALEDEEAAAVLRALARLGDSHGGRLADELDRDPSTVSHHLSRLEDAGLVEREREGRAVVNRLAPEVARVLDEGRDEGDEEIEADREADAEASAIAD